MKHTQLIPALLLSLVLTVACSKTGVDILIDDPQDVEFLQLIDTALLNAFGEENIHFGHTPPVFDSLTFFVDSMEYVVCNRYKYDPITHEPVLSTHNGPGDYDPSRYYHRFYQHHNNLSSHTLLSIGSGGPNDTYKRDNDKVYVIGSGQSFTAYYEEYPDMRFHPTFGILISGTIVTDSLGQFIGIKDYRYGKMYMGYEETPPFGANVYLENSVEVKENRKALAPYFNPDTCAIWQQYHTTKQ